MVDQDRPAWAPSRISISNRWVSSWEATPHSSSWYRRIASELSAQPHRRCLAIGSTLPCTARLSPRENGESRRQVARQTDRYLPVGGIRTRWNSSTGGRVTVYAAIILVPVIALGLVLAANYRAEAERRGLAEGRSEAILMAQTAVEPLLNGQPLSHGLSPAEEQAFRQMARAAISSGNIRRFRLRDLRGRVVFSDDGSGIHQRPEDEVLDAAAGRPVVRLTALNSDSVDTGRVGTESVEAYLPLTAGSPPRRVGVMEVYLPYAPINADVEAGLGDLYRNLADRAGRALPRPVRDLALGTRRLRRQVRLNAYLAEHDTLTGLPNRALFHRAEAPSAGSPRWRIRRHRDHRPRPVQGGQRHPRATSNGDLLLMVLAGRLELYVREARHPRPARRRRVRRDPAASTAPTSPAEVLSRLRDGQPTRGEINRPAAAVEASVGFACAPEDGNGRRTTPAATGRRRDVRREARPRGVVRYRREQDHYDAGQPHAWIGELATAIAKDQLVLHYQPKIDLSDGPGRSPSRRWSAGSTRPTACSTPTRSCPRPSRPS